ncbi:hypothetical protein FRC04_005982 [Tulasnella sp. 424]|nr:hypothetical protein FRC04_005982 [Tulasnella sp. 424]
MAAVQNPRTTYQYVILSANPNQHAIPGILVNPLGPPPEVLPSHTALAPVQATTHTVVAVPQAASVSGVEIGEEGGPKEVVSETKEEEMDLEEEQHYADEVKKLSEELRKAFHDLEDRLQKLEGPTGKATQGKTLLENHLGMGYAVLRRIIRSTIKHFMPNGPNNTQPPTNPDHSPPILRQGEFTFSWDQDVKCRFNLVAVEKLSTYLLLNQTFMGAVLSAAGNCTVLDHHELKRLIKTAFWIHIQYLYAKRRRSLAPPQVQTTRLKNDAVAKRKLTLIKARKAPIMWTPT